MKHVIQHDLDAPLAKLATDRAFAEYRSRYPAYAPALAWTSDGRADVTFNAKGVKLNGNIHVGAGSVALEMDVPFLFRPFQKKAMEIIEREVRVWLNKAKNGELS
jgi:hypothetical protein